MKFKGIMPALVTPLTADGKVNTDAAQKLIEKLISEGADGFYIGGATGEGICMTPEEREVLAECTVCAVGGRAGTIIHIASMVFADAVKLARHAERIGADAISAIPPLFYPYSADEISEYYKKLAEAVHIPLIIYNNPGAGVSFTPEQIVRLFEVDNITGIKWTRPDYYSVMRKRSDTRRNEHYQRSRRDTSSGACRRSRRRYRYDIQPHDPALQAYLFAFRRRKNE